MEFFENRAKKNLIFVLVSVLTLLIFCCFAAVGYVLHKIDEVKASLPDVNKLRKIELSIPTTLLSSDGEVIGELFNEKRYPIELAKVSPHLIQAFLAAEDANFYEHGGLDYMGIVRAAGHYFLGFGNKQGGSTITQQLAKNLLLTRERTIDRKLKDMLLAREIEGILSKDQIFELYLNTIFLGNNSYGVEAAARNYFRKPAAELSLAEASLIAGLAPAPSAYAPTANFKAAKARQKYVLSQMIRLKKITEADAVKASSEELKVFRAEVANTRIAPYFLFEVKKQLETIFKPAELETAGYKIYTTIDSKLQREADKIVQTYMKQFEDKKGFKGPILRSGKDFETALKKMIETPVDLEKEPLRAMVVDLNPSLDVALVVSQLGLGVLLADDHRWALKAGKNKESDVLDFADIVNVGDVVHVKMLERKTPMRIHERASELATLNTYLSFFPNGTSYEGVKFYALADVEQIEGAALLMDSSTGGIKVMVGGSDFTGSQFNRATQAKRQVGSSVKPLYYSYAFDRGFGLASQIDSPPIVIGDWKPENYSKKFLARTTLRSSMINSYNIPSIQLFQALGMDAVASHVRKLGIEFPERDLSAALGSGSATLLEMVQAYTPFANAGKIQFARYIDKIEDRYGNTLVSSQDKRLLASPIAAVAEEDSEKKKIEDEPDPVSVQLEAKKLGFEGEPNQVLSKEAAFLSLAMLENVVIFGTGNNARISGVRVAGKTGTTNGYTDAWFVGMTPGITCGVWVGFDDAQKSLGSSGTGGAMAAPLWRQMVLKALPVLGKKDWVKPESVRYYRIDPETGNPIKGDGGIDVPAMVGFEPGSSKLRHALGMYGLENQPHEEGEEESEAGPKQDDTNENLRSLF